MQSEATSATHGQPSSIFFPLAAALAYATLFSGCGMPGAPQPPSLNLPVPVKNLTAVRTGSQVNLAWTMPARTTDKVQLKGEITVRICRNELNAPGCSAAATVQFAPRADATFTDSLPAPLTAGSPRVISYFVELDNRQGRSAGLSNGAQVLAGEAPPAVENLTAEMSRNGVLLRWDRAPSGSSPFAIRIERRLETPPAAKTEKGSLDEPAEPLEQNLLVEAAESDEALDTHIRFGQTYEYRALRVARMNVNGETLELAGPLSLPLRIDAINVFPPAAPKGLVAIASAGANGSPPAIDLSWLPNTEGDLAGYIVYRRESAPEGQPAEPWRRVSPGEPLEGPAFHDANVQPGHTYAYSVSAIDHEGHESARSGEASDTVPGP
jgi:hypothetical protein